jgi:cytochrome c oxidase cbb3-type subunit 3
MPAWGPVLGTRRITEVVAYVLSHHEPGEPVEIVASPAPGVK